MGCQCLVLNCLRLASIHNLESGIIETMHNFFSGVLLKQNLKTKLLPCPPQHTLQPMGDFQVGSDIQPAAAMMRQLPKNLPILEFPSDVLTKMSFVTELQKFVTNTCNAGGERMPNSSGLERDENQLFIEISEIF